MLLHWFNRLIQKNNRRLVYEQLQWQRFLLRTGVSATAYILDMVEEKDQLPGYVQLRMWMMLRVKGVVTYRHTQTLLSKEQKPLIGDTINIKCCPDDLSRILIV